MSRYDRSKGAEAGFTVAEFVIAIAILFVVLMGVMGGLGFASTASAGAAKRETALNVANQRMEQARNLPYDAIGVRYSDGSYGNPPGEIISPEQVGEFRVTTRIQWARDKTTNRATCKQIYVTVEWDKPRAGSITIESSIAGKSSLVNAGDVLVKVYDIDSSKAISNAWVTVTPSGGVARRVMTDASGEAFFGYVPQGTVAVTVSKDKYAFDVSTFKSVTVNLGEVTTIAVPGMAESIVRVKAQTSQGAALSGADVTLKASDGSVVGTGTTDASGFFSVGALYRGTYTATVAKAGYAGATCSAAIAKGATTVDAIATLSKMGNCIVKVVDNTGAIVSGATVTLVGPAPGTSAVSGSPALTGADGTTQFTLTTGGNYTVSASKTGYTSPANQVVSVTVGSDANVTMTLGKATTGGVRVYLVDRQSKPVANAQVRLYTANNSYNTPLVTDATGQVLFSPLVPGTYYAVSTVKPSTAVSVVVTAGVESPLTVKTLIN